jgi:hypothetical protein
MGKKSIDLQFLNGFMILYVFLEFLRFFFQFTMYNKC